MEIIIIIILLTGFLIIWMMMRRRNRNSLNYKEKVKFRDSVRAGYKAYMDSIQREAEYYDERKKR